MKLTDSAGNELWLEGVNVYLRLKSESRKRKIGTYSEGRFTKQVMSKEHIFQKTQSVGLNYQAIQQLNPDLIVLNVMGEVYKIKRATFERIKEFLHFKKQGFEKQCFLRLSVLADLKSKASQIPSPSQECIEIKNRHLYGAESVPYEEKSVEDKIIHCRREQMRYPTNHPEYQKIEEQVQRLLAKLEGGQSKDYSKDIYKAYE